jgi:hypothetical protein
MAKRPSLTKTVSEAAFFCAWFAETPEFKYDPEAYQRIFERYLNRFSNMPDLALRSIARVAAAEANRSIEAYEKLRPLPVCVKAPVELPADARLLADLIARYKAKSG